MPLKWRGKQVAQHVEADLAPAVSEIGLRIEAEAKRELQPGHGVRTGTLRRSIHADSPSFNFAGDEVTPSESSPERGGKEPTPERQGSRLMIAVGSGLEYAMPVHQGWANEATGASFAGYHFITNALEKVRPKVLDILRKHRKSRRPGAA